MLKEMVVQQKFAPGNRKKDTGASFSPAPTTITALLSSILEMKMWC